MHPNGDRRRTAGRMKTCQKEPHPMVVLGVILLLIGLLLGPPVLTTIGIILLIVGLVLNLAPIGGSRRRVW